MRKQDKVAKRYAEGIDPVDKQLPRHGVPEAVRPVEELNAQLVQFAIATLDAFQCYSGSMWDENLIEEIHQLARKDFLLLGNDDCQCALCRKGYTDATTLDIPIIQTRQEDGQLYGCLPFSMHDSGGREDFEIVEVLKTVLTCTKCGKDLYYPGSTSNGRQRLTGHQSMVNTAAYHKTLREEALKTHAQECKPNE